jgi:hypothetical protein
LKFGPSGMELGTCLGVRAFIRFVLRKQVESIPIPLMPLVD